VTNWGKGTRAAVTEEGGRQRVLFDSTGLADRPLDVRLTRDTESVDIGIAADGSVKVGA